MIHWITFALMIVNLIFVALSGDAYTRSQASLREVDAMMSHLPACGPGIQTKEGPRWFPEAHRSLPSLRIRGSARPG